MFTALDEATGKHPCREDGMVVGERLILDGWPATVVAILAEGAFADGYSALEWDELRTGILVLDDQAGLIHYPDLEGLRVEPISG